MHHGTNGSFDVALNSNKNLNYKILFKSLNNKPKNLQFSTTNNNELIVANSLEELSKKLSGKINKNENINIKIYWKWKYEIDEKIGEKNSQNNIESKEIKQFNKKENNYDIQDTEDAKNIREYKFNILVYGEEN